MKQINYNNRTFSSTPYYQRLPPEEKRSFDLLSRVFHFKVNNYVLENLIDWDQVPQDPVYQYVFPKPEMIGEEGFELLANVTKPGMPESVQATFLQRIRTKLRPQYTYSPESQPKDKEGTPLKGMYSNFPTIVSLFPAPMVITCHSYCNFCFRWIQFGDQQVQADSSYSDPNSPVEWLRSHPEVSDVLFTGADPLICNSKVLWKYIQPILEVDSVKVLRISSKSLAYWPFRFTTDQDAPHLLAMFERITEQGKHLNFCAHFTHPRELEHPEVAKAIAAIRNTGAVIRTQGPLLKNVNDSSEAWSQMWDRQVNLGLIPYYMFIEAGHHPEPCFRVPLALALDIFQRAQKMTTGLARTVRGPVFMLDLHRVLLDGITTVNGDKFFVLKNLQAPPGHHSEGQIKLIPYDPETKSLGNLYELFNEVGFPA